MIFAINLEIYIAFAIISTTWVDVLTWLMHQRIQLPEKKPVEIDSSSANTRLQVSADLFWLLESVLEGHMAGKDAQVSFIHPAWTMPPCIGNGGGVCYDARLHSTGSSASTISTWFRVATEDNFVQRHILWLRCLQ